MADIGKRPRLFLYPLSNLEPSIKKLLPTHFVIVISVQGPLKAITKINGYKPKKEDVVVLSIAVAGEGSDLWKAIQSLLDRKVSVLIITKKPVPAGANAFESMDALFPFLALSVPDPAPASVDQKPQKDKRAKAKPQARRRAKKRVTAYDSLQPRLFD